MNPPATCAKTLTFQRVRFAMRRNPRRTGLLGGLLVAMLTFGGRLLVTGPAAATASLIRSSAVTRIDPPQPAAHAPVGNAVMDWLAQPRRSVDRNLFTINPDFYTNASEETNGINADVDTASEPRFMKQDSRAPASQFKLQTTLMDSSPSAMINGQLVREGDLISGFTVVRIVPGKIVLRRVGVELEIAMP
jgi:hypothetical protein